MHFKDGIKYDDVGQRVNPVDHRQFVSSNGVTIYTVTKWADGSFSCNCPAWAFRKRCKHSMADAWRYGTSIAAPVTVAVTLKSDSIKRVRRLVGSED